MSLSIGLVAIKPYQYLWALFGIPVHWSIDTSIWHTLIYVFDRNLTSWPQSSCCQVTFSDLNWLPVLLSSVMLGLYLLYPAPHWHSRFSITSWGGGGVKTFVSAPVGHREEKTFESSSKIITKVFQLIFHSGQNSGLQVTWAKNAKKFKFFRDWRTSDRKSSIISGTIIARANPKTAFERD